MEAKIVTPIKIHAINITGQGIRPNNVRSVPDRKNIKAKDNPIFIVGGRLLNPILVQNVFWPKSGTSAFGVSVGVVKFQSPDFDFINANAV